MNIGKSRKNIGDERHIGRKVNNFYFYFIPMGKVWIIKGESVIGVTELRRDSVHLCTVIVIKYN